MKNLRRLACKFYLDQSESKSSQVNLSERESQVDPGFQLILASTCDSVWLGLNPLLSDIAITFAAVLFFVNSLIMQFTK